MKTISQKWMATHLFIGVATLNAVFSTQETNAQSVLQQHLKTKTSAPEATSPPAQVTSPPVQATSPTPPATAPPAQAATPPAQAATPPAQATTPPPQATTPPVQATRTSPEATSTSPETKTTASDLSLNGHEDLDATLWVKFAAEYKAITRQTFLAATSQLGSALATKNWTAVVAKDSEAESSILEGESTRPACVIMDVDETVLDNSAYQQELILNNSSFSGESWSRFVNSKKSPAVPGAKSFVDTCRRMGVTVFFVTNRDFSLEAATRENLISEGLMKPSDPDLILSKNERPEWTSGKSVRRESIAAKHRVLLLLGDDLNDFLFVKKSNLKQRSQLAKQYQRYWGERWFMLPNPDYGSWEMAVTNNSTNTTAAEKTRQKMKTLGGQ